ncbi:hypothetical protein SAMN05216266_12433 [Amycolatopsis marina]|uniref:DUF6542 domain-containing protein n=1 Tax=Amycolatopsis marina TaxID=490629 RepID=A0A1I1CAM8_9PSEU|nr:hypothetical protein SAMN05216266_12433 [Amycolatopsis marina]
MIDIRDAQNDAEADDTEVPWDELPIFGDRRGLPWWGAVLLAFGLAILGAGMNLQMQDSLGVLFQGCYFVGSVAAVAAVRRRNLFGPMVQPPLVLGFTVPAIVLLGSGLPENSDTLAKALAIGTPLINGFPTMAITTGVTLAIGIFRLYRERDPDAPVKVRSSGKRASKPEPKAAKEPKSRKAAPDKAAAAAKAAGKPGQGSTVPPRKGKPAPADGRPDAPRRGEGRGRQATEGRGAGEPARRRGQDDPRGRPAERESGKAPRDPGARKPRQPRQPGAERRPRAEGTPDSPGSGRPRRTPPRGDAPRGGRPDAPRRGPEPGGRPPRGRPWNDEPPPRSAR